MMLRRYSFLKVVIPILLVGGIIVTGAVFGPLYKAVSSVVKIEDGLYRNDEKISW